MYNYRFNSPIFHRWQIIHTNQAPLGEERRPGAGLLMGQHPRRRPNVKPELIGITMTRIAVIITGSKRRIKGWPARVIKGGVSVKYRQLGLWAAPTIITLWRPQKRGFHSARQSLAAYQNALKRWTRDDQPMLVYRWATVFDDGPTLNQNCLNVSCLLGLKRLTWCRTCSAFTPYATQDKRTATNPR